MREMRIMAKQIVHADDMSWVLDPGEPFWGRCATEGSS